MPAAKALADVYALSFFIPHEEDDEVLIRQPKKVKKSSEDGVKSKKPGAKKLVEDEDE